MSSTDLETLRDHQQAAANIRADLVARRARIAETTHAIAQLRSWPVPPAEVVEQRIPAAVAYYAEQFRAEYAQHLVRGLADVDAGAAVQSLSRYDHLAQLTGFPALCCGDPARATALLRGLVAAVGAYEAGPPSDTRPERIAALEAELAELQADEEAFVDTLQGLGLGVEHRPEVLERRAREQAQAARDQAIAAAAEVRQAPVDQQHAAAVARRPASSISNYLSTGGRF